MFSNNRADLRQMYFEVFEKTKNGSVLTPLENQISEVILQHPEYHAFLEDEDAQVDQDFSVELGQNNPFLHMGLHLALREQVGTNRPIGIQSIYQAQCHKLGDQHKAEHGMIEILAESIWSAQKNNTAPDERAYLENLKAL